MLGFIAKKIFGTRNDRVIASFLPIVARVNELEASVKALRDDEFPLKTAEFKARVAKGESLESIMPEAFALVREAGLRALGMRHYDVQLLGGAILNSGRICELKTGEGKTLVATLAAYLNSLTGNGVHVVTVNDYLVRRDAEWMGYLYRFLGVSVGCVWSGMGEAAKKEAYLADITYGQNNEFGFDYLRDNMKFELSGMNQRGHAFAIVDEVDSILIDEARTPLIISGASDEATDKYYAVNKIIPSLKAGVDFEIELRTKQPTLTETGVGTVEKLLGIPNLYDPSAIELLHHVQQGLRAHTIMVRDVDYVIKDGEIIIVDEFTGRLMAGRRWSDGLHQAVEAKEGLKVHKENKTLASITFQNYFRMYKKLSGMTGTADTEAVELKQIYNLEVIIAPPNKPNIRKDLSDEVYRTRKEKYGAVVEDIVEINKTGQPILVGTISIEQSEYLSRMLSEKGVPHHVLNAKAHEREAEIIAQAGRFGSVTISTNMAGRGTDIILGGNPEFLAANQAGTKDRNDPAFQAALAQYQAECRAEHDKVVAAGGLFVMGTERHEARRIDNQLRGRAGRQGDPGSSRFFVSLEDDLMKRFGGDRLQAIMQRLGWEEGMAMDGRMVSGSIEKAQKRVEGFHFDARKHVTDYDDVMNKQRQVIYNLRNKLLRDDAIRAEILNVIDDLVEDAVLVICDEKKRPLDWDTEALAKRYETLFAAKAQFSSNDEQINAQGFFDLLRTQAKTGYDAQVKKLSDQIGALRSIFEDGKGPFDLTVEELERDVFLGTLDQLWNQHLTTMDHVRDGIGLRGYGQKNPLHEYQKEGFALFQTLIATLKEQVVRQLFHYKFPKPEEYLAHLEAEKKRREALEKQVQFASEVVAAASGKENKDPSLEAKSKADALRKARRKL